MTRQPRLALASALVLGVALPAAAADSLKTVEQKIIKAWQQHKSMTAKLKIATQMKQGDKTVNGGGEGTYEFVRKGKLTPYRMEVKGQSVIKSDGEETAQDYHNTAISDGKFIHSLMDVGGKPFATKMKVVPGNSPDPKGMFQMLRKVYQLKLLPPGKIDGKEVYVIEASPRRKRGPIVMRMRLCYSHDGVLVRQVVSDSAGKSKMTSTYTDIKFDVKIDPERFVFKPPPGVTVREVTPPQQ